MVNMRSGNDLHPMNEHRDRFAQFLTGVRNFLRNRGVAMRSCEHTCMLVPTYPNESGNRTCTKIRVNSILLDVYSWPPIRHPTNIHTMLKA